MKFPRAEFFDIFGLGTFAVIFFISARALFWGISIPHWAVVFLFVIGIAGLIIDGIMVYSAYFMSRNNSGSSGENVVK